MNWYKIFYWISVADGVKGFFDVFSNIATWILVISFIIYIILIFCRLSEASTYGRDTNDYKSLDVTVKGFSKIFYVFLVLSFITWMGYVFVPTKKDALVIVAGGAVGNFITKDTSAKQIPSEVMTLLRDKIRSEIKEVHVVDAITDTLAGKTKEELIEMIKDKSTH